MNTINVENCKTLLIGRRGENEVTTVAFDFTEWASEFGSGVVDLYVKRFGDDSAYPVVLTVDGTVASWLVTETDTNVAGYGKAEYVYRVDGKIAKSAVFPFFVAEDIGQPASEPPDPYESWLEQLTALGAETEAHAQAAEQSAENAAESAEDAAESAASAEGYAGQAETAAGLAQAAQTASEAARDAAQTAQASAEASATAASGSAASAAGSATAAAGSASDASSSASAAGVSATTASTAAGQAEAAKTAAQAAQSAAEDAAEDAQQAAQQAHVEYEQLSSEVDDLSDEVSQQKSAIEALDSLVDRKAGILVDTASGAIASFVPDATIENLLGVTVDIDPVQDLHGYDSPWPAGGGVNKLSSDNMSRFTQKNYGVQYTVQADGGIAAAGTVTTTTWNFAQFYATLDDFGLSVGDTVALSCFGDNVNFAIHFYADNTMIRGIDATGTPVGVIPEGTNRLRMLVYCKASSAPTVGEVINKTFYPQLEKASTPSTVWHPYSNICPISGWTGANVTRTGKNLIDVDTETVYQKYLTTYNVWRPSSDSRSYAFKCKPNTTYTVSTDNASIILFRVAYIKSSSPDSLNDIPCYGQQRLTRSGSITITTDSEATYIVVQINISIVEAKSGNLQFELGSTASDYEPYSGTTVTVSFGQTVYGAVLDATAGTLTIDRANIESYNGETLPGEWISDRDVYSAGATPTIGAQVVYKLATPIEIQLDPVTISTISGQSNNVWADAGDTTVEFAADLKHYIDSKIAAAVAALS